MELFLGCTPGSDNPRASKSPRLGIPVYSFPEFIFQSKSAIKKEVSIGVPMGRPR